MRIDRRNRGRPVLGPIYSVPGPIIAAGRPLLQIAEIIAAWRSLLPDVES